MGASNLLHSILLTQPRVRHPTGCLLEWSHAHCPNFTLFWGGEGWRHASDYLGIYSVNEESFVSE